MRRITIIESTYTGEKQKMQNTDCTLKNAKISTAFSQHLLSLASHRIHQPEIKFSELSLAAQNKSTQQEPHFTNFLPYPTAILSQFSA